MICRAFLACARLAVVPATALALTLQWAAWAGAQPAQRVQPNPNAVAPATPRERRPMVIHKVHELGLEIWTEANPRWRTQLGTESGKEPIFVAETPDETYPPAGMMWAVPGIKFSAAEFEKTARDAMRQAATNYGVSVASLETLTLRPAQYGELSGYESEFSASPQGVAVEVRVFFGHKPDRPAVAMQAYTLGGKLQAISEQIRRSWTNVRYLEP
jgi:hypothetical protein